MNNMWDHKNDFTESLNQRTLSDLIMVPKGPRSAPSQDAFPKLYETCVANTSSESAALQCMINSLEYRTNDSTVGLDVLFLLYAAALVFFMQAGFAMLCAGSVRMKNVQNTMLKNILDACGAALGFWSIGYAFAFGDSQFGNDKTFIGNGKFFLIGETNYVFWTFQFAFAATSATIVAGTLAERCQMTAYLMYSMMLTGFVYPVIVHNVWSSTGFLSPIAKDPLWGSGVIDFAGSGVVHLTGGITAVFASYILGARKGRFHDAHGRKLKKPKVIPGHSAALQVLGLFILWFSWYGFNAGSASYISTSTQAKVTSLTVVNTTLSAASSGVTALIINLITTERRTGEATFNLMKCMNGCLAGLVSITAGCSSLEPWAAVATGFVAGILYLSCSELLVLLCLDDAVDAIPVHMANGAWGLISVGLMASPKRLQDVYGRSEHAGWFYSWGRGSGDATLLACQICCILFILGWVLLIMFPFFCFLNYKGWFRADALTEIVGLDLSYHGGSYSGGNDIPPEYLRAYNERKAKNRNAHSHAHQSDDEGRRASRTESKRINFPEVEAFQDNGVDLVVGE